MTISKRGPTHCPNGHLRTPETVKANGNCRLCPRAAYCSRGHFLKSSNLTSDGKCLACMRARSRRHAVANRERMREASRRHYAENKDAYRQRDAAWRANNPEAAAAIYRRYADRHPDRLAERWRVRKGRKDPDTLRFLRMIAGDRCAYCAGPYEENDHILPVVHGGSDHWTNLAPACRSCNRRKSARLDWTPWRIDVFHAVMEGAS